MTIKLPWSRDEYTKLTEEDFLGPPTAEMRVRVAAAFATHSRDCNMLGEGPIITMESLRSILTMTAEQWETQVSPLAAVALAESAAFDPEAGEVRYEQTVFAMGLEAAESSWWP